MAEELRFDGKVVMVTGGAVGLGRAYSLLLAERGATVVVNGNVRESGVGPEAEVAAEIRALGGEAISVNGSVADDSAARRMVREAIDAYGRLDVLINNAGTASQNPAIFEAPDESSENQIEVHMRGHLRMARAAFPHLAKAGNARILNTGSAVAFGYQNPNGWDGAYTVAKSALYGVTRQMAGAGAEYGINCNMIMPWSITPLVERQLGHTPFGKWMREKLDPSKVAAVVAYLVHASCPATGQFISAAGGRITRVVFASPPGYFNAEITPEAVRDNWATIWGEQDANGDLHDYFEVTGQQLEFAKIKECVGD